MDFAADSSASRFRESRRRTTGRTSSGAGDFSGARDEFAAGSGVDDGLVSRAETGGASEGASDGEAAGEPERSGGWEESSSKPLRDVAFGGVALGAEAGADFAGSTVSVPVEESEAGCRCVGGGAYAENLSSTWS